MTLIGRAHLPPRARTLMTLRARDREAVHGDIAAEWRLRRVKISSRVRLTAHRCRCAPASPQVAARQDIDERHERDEAEQSPCQLRTTPDITAARQVNPHEDHGDGMEETDHELQNLLHYLNLPGSGAGG